MDRRERDHDYYGGYEGYSRDDAHYHSARNLTDQFERDYRREHPRSGRGQNQFYTENNYYAGDMGEAYRYQGDENQGYASDRQPGRGQNKEYVGDYSRVRGDYDNFSSDEDDGWRNRNRGWGSDNMRQGYGSSNRYGSQDWDSSNRGSHFGSGDYDDRGYRNEARDYGNGSNYAGRYGSQNRDRYDRDDRSDEMHWGYENRRSDYRNRYY